VVGSRNVLEDSGGEHAQILHVDSIKRHADEEEAAVCPRGLG
jgi:hypothetical protein